MLLNDDDYYYAVIIYIRIGMRRAKKYKKKNKNTHAMVLVPLNFKYYTCQAERIKISVLYIQKIMMNILYKSLS